MEGKGREVESRLKRLFDGVNIRESRLKSRKAVNWILTVLILLYLSSAISGCCSVGLIISF